MIQSLLDTSPQSTYERLQELWSEGEIPLPLFGKSPLSYREEIDQTLSLATPPHDAFLALATSGSSGESQFYAYTKENLKLSALATLRFYAIDSHQRFLISLPLNHIGGIMTIIRSQISHGELIIPASYDQEELRQHIKYSKADYLSLVPAQLEKFLHDSATANALKKMKGIFLGGQRPSSSLLTQIEEEKLPIALTYGMTETAAMIAGTHWGQIDGMKAFQGIDLHQSPEGRLKISCGKKFARYSFYQKRWVETDFYQQNSLLTKDLVEFNEDRFTILGRCDSVFISGGENIRPEDIESELRSLEFVSEAIVVSTPHKKFGEVGFAFVEMDTPYSLEKVEDELRLRLPSRLIPKYFYFLRKNNSFKKLKYQRWKLTDYARSLLADIHKHKPHPEPSLFFWHGFMGNAQEYASHLPPKTLTFDLPGHGEFCSAINSPPFSFMEHIDDVAQYYALFIKEHYSFDKRIKTPAMGYSMGARVLLCLHRLYPNFFSKLWSISPSLGIEDFDARKKRLSDDEKLFPSKVTIDFFVRWFSMELFALSENHIQTMATQRFREYTSSWSEGLTLMSVGNQLPLTISQMDLTKIIYIAGEKDTKYVRTANALSWHQKIIVENCGHNPLIPFLEHIFHGS